MGTNNEARNDVVKAKEPHLKSFCFDQDDFMAKSNQKIDIFTNSAGNDMVTPQWIRLQSR